MSREYLLSVFDPPHYADPTVDPELGVCWSCGADIVWITTKKRVGGGGKKAPMDLVGGTSHYATCPQAEWRKPR